MRQLAGLVFGLAACSGPLPESGDAHLAAQEPLLFFRLELPSARGDFRSSSGEFLRFDAEGQRLEGPLGRWNTRLHWGAWGVLRDCVGDPLSPHFADPEALVAFRTTTLGEWVVRYSGLNDCGIKGEAVLRAHKDSVDVSRLTVGGKLWHEGGREALSLLLKIQLREEAEERYLKADIPGRILLLKRLSEDPQAEEALARLEERFPLDKEAIRQARSRLSATQVRSGESD